MWSFDKYLCMHLVLTKALPSVYLALIHITFLHRSWLVLPKPKLGTVSVRMGDKGLNQAGCVSARYL